MENFILAQNYLWKDTMAVYSTADRGFHALMNYDKDSINLIKRDAKIQKLGLDKEWKKEESIKL